MNETTFLSFFLIVVGLPVGLGIGGSLFKRWLDHKERLATTLSQVTAEKAANYAARIERLEGRMAVLERILTDRATRLGDEIEALRTPAPLN